MTLEHKPSPVVAFSIAGFFGAVFVFFLIVSLQHGQFSRGIAIVIIAAIIAGVALATGFSYLGPWRRYRAETTPEQRIELRRVRDEEHAAARRPTGKGPIDFGKRIDRD